MDDPIDGTFRKASVKLGTLTVLIVAMSFLVPEPSSTSGRQEPALRRFTDSRVRMGVPFNITVYADDESTANAAINQAFGRIRTLNKVFSDYNPNSEVRRITAKPKVKEPVPIGDDLRILLERSLAFSRQTDGAFDVTISPVVKLWRLADRSGKKPGPQKIAAALERVGWEHLALDAQASTLTFNTPGMELDFGAIAKGYACDEALEVLASHGMTRALVEAGGDLACGDPPPGKAGWVIAVEAHSGEKEAPPQYIVVKNQGVATSGDVNQFVEFDGVRYSHIVDPRTGMGLTTRSSATVIAPDGTTADALASAVSVLGPETGKCLVESLEGVEMLMVSIDQDGATQTVTSDGFEFKGRGIGEDGGSEE